MDPEYWEFFRKQSGKGVEPITANDEQELLERLKNEKLRKESDLDDATKALLAKTANHLG